MYFMTYAAMFFGTAILGLMGWQLTMEITMIGGYGPFAAIVLGPWLGFCMGRGLERLSGRR